MIYMVVGGLYGNVQRKRPSVNTSYDAYALFVGIFPFRGIHVALVPQRKEYGDLLHVTTPSGVFSVSGRDAPRMGMFQMSVVFGSLPSKTFETIVDDWQPMSLADITNAIELPFKINGRVLPM
jgi:hypothetical protein